MTSPDTRAWLAAALLLFCRSREVELNAACDRVVAYARIRLERK